MRPRHAVMWHQVVNDLADALERAIRLASEGRWQSRTTAAEATLLAQSLSRAVEVLDRVPQPERRASRRAAVQSED
jgi:hypothetical protein